jgi:distribution and morphology protein 34
VEDTETIPAVGGGFITRPRVYHSQSSIKSPLTSGPSTESRPSSSRKGRESLARAQSDCWAPGIPRSRGLSQGMTPLHHDRGMGMEMDGRMTSAYNPYFGDAHKGQPGGTYGQLEEAGDDGKESTPENMWRGTGSASRPIPRSPGTGQAGRRQSISSDRQRSVSRSPPTNDPFRYGSPSKQHLRNSSDEAERDPMTGFGSDRHRGHNRGPRGIILRNQSASHLSALSKSNQTLSPYTRSFSHFTVRSGPPKPLVSNTTPFSYSANKGTQKARRKRIHRIGGSEVGHIGRTSINRRKGAGEGEGNISLDRVSQSPPPPSEFSDDDVAHYFRARRPSEIQSPGRRDKILLNPDVSGSLRKRTTSHSSQHSRQRTGLSS